MECMCRQSSKSSCPKQMLHWWFLRFKLGRQPRGKTLPDGQEDMFYIPSNFRQFMESPNDKIILSLLLNSCIFFIQSMHFLLICGRFYPFSEDLAYSYKWTFGKWKDLNVILGLVVQWWECLLICLISHVVAMQILFYGCTMNTLQNCAQAYNDESITYISSAWFC